MDLSDYSDFLSEHNKALEHRLPILLKSCFASLDAALWLIAGTNYAQALSLLHNSIELAFKAELAKIHPLLIADNRKLDYETFKSFLKDEFSKHDQGSRLNINDFDLDKTITFTDALSRVKELYPGLFKEWDSGLKELQKHRNQIIHYGANEKDFDQYVHIIASTAIPFLDEFLIASNQVFLDKLLGSGIYHETVVARKVADRLQSERLPSQKYILRTVRRKILRAYSELPEPEGEEGHKVGFEKDYLLGEQAEKIIDLEWAGDYSVEIFCKICDSVRTFVKVQPVKEPVLGLIPLALYCPICGLKITEDDKYLALYHVGEIDKEIVDKFFDENRSALEDDGFF